MIKQSTVSRIKLPVGYELDVENFLLNKSFHDFRIIEHHWNSGDYYVQVKDLGHRLTFKFSGNVDITYPDYRPELIKEFDKILGEDQEEKRDWIIGMGLFDFLVSLMEDSQRLSLNFCDRDRGFCVSCDEVSIVEIDGFCNNEAYLRFQEELKCIEERRITEFRIEKCIERYVRVLYMKHSKPFVFKKRIMPIADSQSRQMHSIIAYLHRVHKDLGLKICSLFPMINTLLRKDDLPTLNENECNIILDSIRPFEQKYYSWDECLAVFEGNYVALCLLLSYVDHYRLLMCRQLSWDFKDWQRERSRVYKLYAHAYRDFMDRNNDDSYRPFIF